MLKSEFSSNIFVTLDLNTDLPFQQRIRNLPRQFLRSIKTLNLFPSSPPSNDEYRLKTQRMSTFFYIILLIIGCLVLLIYTATETITQTVTIQEPSLDQYQTLYDEQPEKLVCPCSTITSPYQSFLSVDSIFHPVCASDFVNDNWMNYKYSSNTTLYLLDFRNVMSSIAHYLELYCELANKTIFDALIAFNTTQLVSVELLSENLFHKKTQQLNQPFIQSTVRIFSYNLESIRTTTKGNSIMSGLNTNAVILFTGATLDVISFSLCYPDCSVCVCSTIVTCISDAAIRSFNGTQYNIVYTVPGFYQGCYLDEALRRSTLECYFNQSCIDTLKFYLGVNQSLAIKPLDSNAISSFNITSPLDYIITNLMVDRWVMNDSFKNYFEECHPSSCYYTLVTRMPLIVILTTLIGLYGGLAKVLRILVPLIMRFIRRGGQAQALQPSKY